MATKSGQPEFGSSITMSKIGRGALERPPARAAAWADHSSSTAAWVAADSCRCRGVRNHLNGSWPPIFWTFTA